MARVDYDRMAPAYVTGRALPPEGMAPWRDAIRPWLPRDLGDRSPVLDLGAGTGQFAAAIAGWFGVEVVAVEPSGGMRAQAARAFSHGGVRWVAGLAERLPLGDRTCAWAWVSTVVHHLDDLEAAAAELRRVLRPGAPVLVRQAFPGRMDEISLYRRFFPAAGASLVEGGGLPSVERLSAVFAGAGFRAEGLQAVDQVSATSLAAYRDKVRLRADTGLRLLPDDEFAAGLAALDRAVEAETSPAPVVDRIDLLVLRR
ncbi:MAG TPA: class I SAM-dependent methyltransferase [Actinomycetes bacterium]|nr:class I SAM-dependent methyltransferase [Actinomycetes bacterium]